MSTTSWICNLLCVASLTSCVSVSLSPPDEAKRASGVVFKNPHSRFSKESRQDVDAAWKNNANGNVISYLSDCKDPSDPSLDSILQGVLSGVSELQPVSRQTITHQAREARRVVVSGKVDGVPTMMDLMVFKRNQCIYILSYLGVQSSFAADQSQFNTFIEGFRAP